MIAGDPFKRSFGGDFASQAVSFVCLDYSGESSQTNGLPNKVCPDGLRAQVFFPSCWDGVNVDSTDHQSHMAYPTKYSYDNGPCPASHPVHLISIFFEVIYSTAGFEWWNGTQQPFVFAQGDPTGYGFHGDFLNGWDVEVLQNATDRCTNDSGLITDCDVFDFFTTQESQACILEPTVDEAVTGTLEKLPGCNPVVWGPDYAYTDLDDEESNTCASNASITAGTGYSTDVSNLGWSYIGCGSDDTSTRTFNGASWFSNNMTVQNCVNYCYKKGYTYAGMEYSSQCFCDNTLPSDRAPVAGVLGNCFSTCAGNSSQYCGGSNRLSMYNLTNSAIAKAANPTSTSTTSSTPTATALSCPSANNTMYNATNGANFMIECGIDRSGGDMGMVYVAAGSISQCLEKCANTTGCQDVSLSGSACYMKSKIMTAQGNSGIVGGRIMLASSASSSSASASTTSASSTGSSSKASLTMATSTIASSSGSSSNLASSSSNSSSLASSTIASSSGSSSGHASSTTGSSGSSSSLASSSGSSSSLASSTTGSSTASASPTSTLCPATNNQTLTDTNGNNYTIHCSADSSVGSYANAQAAKSYLDCMTQCDKSTGCTAFTYVGGTYGSGSGTCWLKNSASGMVSAATNYIFGVLNNTASVSTTSSKSSSSASFTTSMSSSASSVSSVNSVNSVNSASSASSASSGSTTTTGSSGAASATATSNAVLSCPDSNSTVYTASNGNQYMIECGIDRSGGDLAMKYVNNFEGCIMACAFTSGCVDVSLSGSACYMKKSVGSPVYNGVYGARLITATSSASSATATANSKRSVKFLAKRA